MAHLPSFEEILSEVHFRLGLKALANKRRFTEYGMEISGHIERAQQLRNEIYEALELDERSRKDASKVVDELSSILKTIEQKTWTGGASQQQVLWQTLACIHVPVWARNIAFWSLANTEHDLPPIDAGMPGGEFWFLPTGSPESREVKLPVTKVVEWLLDLLGAPAIDELRTAIGNKNLREKEGGNDAAVRTLRNWLAGAVPKDAGKIEEIFPDDAALSFNGAFALDRTWAPDIQFENALKFVVDHKIDREQPAAEQLSEQIPMKPERLRPIFAGSASEDEREEFVRYVSIRYAAPDMATVRQRLRVARLVQQGYRDLVNYLCPDLLPEQAHDPQQNKVLQLIGLFETIYNKTIQAWHHGDTDAEQDAWFEAQFAPWDSYDLLLTIVPSRNWMDRVNLLSDRLARRFLALDSQQGPQRLLEDVLPASDADIEAVVVPRIKRIQLEMAEDQRCEKLRQQIRAGSPKRAMQAESSYWVLNKFVKSEGLTDWIRECALNRMIELAAFPLERGAVQLLKLDSLLNADARSRPKDIRQKVQGLLAEAQADNKAWELWKAPMLFFQAKHALFESRLADAEKDFNAALEACSERAFGGLRGDIAHDGFATAIVRGALNPKTHAPYYRNILHFMEFPNGVPSFEDAAADCEEYFWKTLYQPYPGVEPFEGPGRTNSRAVMQETFGLIETEDWDGLHHWMERNARYFRKERLKDVRGSSVLMQWLKLLHDLEKKLPAMRMMLPPELVEKFGKIEAHVRNRREAVRLLAKSWPEQVGIADFKRQTPLMLVADNGDAELVSLMLPHSNIDAQDYLGRTAFHAAVAGRSTACLEAILDKGPDVLKVSEYEGNTALHTAVRFAWPHGLRLIVGIYPELLGAKNVEGQTPLGMARDIAANYETWRSFMHQKQNRRMGNKSDLDEVLALLEAHEAT